MKNEAGLEFEYKQPDLLSEALDALEAFRRAQRFAHEYGHLLDAHEEITAAWDEADRQCNLVLEKAGRPEVKK